MTDTIVFKNGDALLIVDVQNDFCPGGALAVEKGDTILPAVNAWIKAAHRFEIPIYASRDWHPKNHVSFTEQGGRWPPHCIQDTEGAAFHPNLELPDQTTVITKGVRFDRDQNSVFADTGLAEHLKDKGIRRLFVGGLALDVCVLDSVMDATKEYLDVVLITEATRPVDPNEIPNVTARMKGVGVVFTDSNTLADMADEVQWETTGGLE